MYLAHHFKQSFEYSIAAETVFKPIYMDHYMDSVANDKIGIQFRLWHPSLGEGTCIFGLHFPIPSSIPVQDKASKFDLDSR